MSVRIGDWVRGDPESGEPFVGTVIRQHSNNAWHVRCVVNGVEAVRVAYRGAEKLTLLEVMAAEATDGYWPNPSMRVCENEDCVSVLREDWTPVYCSTRCALMDA